MQTRSAASILFTALAIIVLQSCGGPENCTPKAHSFCNAGIVYWADSCGRLGDVKEYCGCGCTSERSACEDCECTCTQPGACCDGCRAIREGEVCNDGDETTINDCCTDAVCSGWSPDDIEPPTAPAEPSAPAEPDLPRLVSWSCPAGWVPVTHDTQTDENGDPFSWCEPPPVPRLKLGTYVTPLAEDEQEGDRPICEPEVDGTFPVLGQEDCQPLGNACPGGDWPEVPPEVTGNRIYVLSGAAGGNGTQASPFGTIGEAVASAVGGDVVVIGAGIYPEAVTIDKNLTLWGKCVIETIIDAPGPHGGIEAGAVVVAENVTVEVFNLQIRGAQIGLNAASSGSHLTAAGVWIHAATCHGALANTGELNLIRSLIDSTNLAEDYYGRGANALGGSKMELVSSCVENTHGGGIMGWEENTEVFVQDCVVRSTRNYTEDTSSVFGVAVMDGAALEIGPALVQANYETGIFSHGQGSRLTVNNVVVFDTLGRTSDGGLGVGLAAVAGGQIEAKQFLSRRNHTSGLSVYDTGSFADYNDIVVLDTLPEEETGLHGHGLTVQYGGQMALKRGLFQGNRVIGVSINESQSSDFEDLVVLDTGASASNDSMGHGLYIDSGSLCSVTRVLLDSNRDVAAFASDTGTELDMQDITITNTLSRKADLTGGIGIMAYDAGTVTASRVSLANNRDMGIVAYGANSSVSLEDAKIFSMLSQEATNATGIGLGAIGGGQLDAQRILIDKGRTAGVLVYGQGTTATLTDIAVVDTQAQENDASLGFGLQLHEGAQAIIERSLFERNVCSAIGCSGNESSIAFTDLTVKETLPEEDSGAYGVGMTINEGCSVSVQRALVDENRTIGILVHDPGSSAELADVTVSNTLSQEADGKFGMGLHAHSGAVITGQRLLITDNRYCGVSISGEDTSMDAEDLIVRGTQGNEVSADFGRGMSVQYGARVSLTKTKLSDNHEIGLSVFEQTTDLDLDHVAIFNTRAAQCSAPPDPTCDTPGRGMLVTLGAMVEFSALTVDGSDLIGIQLANQGAITGHGLQLSNNTIGVNISDSSVFYDFFLAVKGLWMLDNRVNFGSHELAVPSPLDLLE